MEPYCGADAVRNACDDRQFPAGRLCALDGRRICRQHLLGRGVRPIVSWIVAVVFTPYLGVKMLPAIKPIEGGHHAIYGTPNYQRLRGLITFAVRHKFLTCGIVAIAFALSVVGMGAVKQRSSRPPTARSAGGGSPAGRHQHRDDDRHGREARTLAGASAGGQDRQSYVGQGAPRFFFAMAPELPDPAFAKIVVLTPDAEAREL